MCIKLKERPICKWTVIEEGYKTDCGGIIEDFQGDIYCPNCGGKVDRTGVNFKKTAEEIIKNVWKVINSVMSLACMVFAVVLYFNKHATDAIYFMSLAIILKIPSPMDE